MKILELIVPNEPSSIEKWKEIPNIPDQYVYYLAEITKGHHNPFGRGVNGIKRCLKALSSITGDSYKVSWDRCLLKRSNGHFMIRIFPKNSD